MKKTSRLSYFYGMSDSNGDENSTGYVRGESFGKKTRSWLLPPPSCVQGLGKRTDSAKLSWHRDNDHNISPSGGKGALPARASPSPTSYFDYYSRFDVVGNARRQRFFLNRPRRLHHILFFFPHLFAFPQLVPAATTTPSWGKLFNEH